ncbi:LOW QUALITY PROTEIN: hypothetical protein HID58_093077 [Brassica napus]|uniref:Uncharacterized protein n=1 Tax=Brassica napus TaxID=3708 RepID=A0ABQ7XDT4_BRANA|nr:LOW QUALITY PROTEIN: hypothetical protein HID58_093077 [Brassica napus]
MDFVGASEDPSVPLRPEGCSSRVKERVQTIFSDNTSGLKINSISNLKHLNTPRLQFQWLDSFFTWKPFSFSNIHLSGNTSGGETPTPSFGRLNHSQGFFLQISVHSPAWKISKHAKTLSLELSLLLSSSHHTLSGTIDLADQLRSVFWNLTAKSLSPTRYIFKNATSLRSLNLGHNHFVGKLPRSLISCSALEPARYTQGVNITQPLKHFVVWYSSTELSSSNQVWCLLTSLLTHYQLKNFIFTWKLTNLSTLDLSSNFFNGHIPSSFGNLLHLTSLVISSNRLSGQIPPPFANLNQLTTLSLVSNKLSGNFPLPCITQSHKVVRVITGTLPPNISALCNLETFEASENIFTGNSPFYSLQHPFFDLHRFEDNQLNAILEFGNISSPSKLERFITWQ